MNYCIYEKNKKLNFSKVEHIIPAGLGGTKTLPKGYVSDEINEFFSAIEAKALRTTLISGFRNFIGPGHRGKMTVSKKLNPHMNILKLNKKYKINIDNIYKSKMGFMLDRKTVFISQIAISFNSNLEVKHAIYCPGVYNDINNNLKAFLDSLKKIEEKNIIFVQTEHDIEYKGAILGTFYGKWYIYINVPLITSNYIIKSILDTNDKSKIEISLLSGGEYDFSYKINRGYDDENFTFLYVKTAFNTLAYIVGHEKILESRYDEIRYAIVNNETHNFIGSNDNSFSKKWIHDRTENEPHVVLFQKENKSLYAYVSFYGDLSFKIFITNNCEEDFVNQAFVSDWRNRKDYLVNI